MPWSHQGLEERGQFLVGPLEGNVPGQQAVSSSYKLRADERPFMKIPQETRISIRSTPAASQYHLQTSLADRTLSRVVGTTY